LNPDEKVKHRKNAKIKEARTKNMPTASSFKKRQVGGEESTVLITEIPEKKGLDQNGIETWPTKKRKIMKTSTPCGCRQRRVLPPKACAP